MAEPRQRNDDLDHALERTVPSESFSADGLRRELERTREDDTPTATPQSFLIRTETENTPYPTEETTGLGGFGDTGAMPPKLIADDEQGGPRFKIVDEVGTGGTSRVYAVQDRSLNRTVALKLLRGKRAAKPGVEQRFIHEARVTAMLEHPNIMPVHDIGTTDNGRVYFTMKNIAGVSLGDAIRAEKACRTAPEDFRSVNGKLGMFLRICDALSFAHDRGFIHQDVKPDNIMLGEYGEVLLLDWGCALTTAEALQTDNRPAYGTPAYMSPEQARREAVDERSDVYCLGATLYHALTLQHPTWDKDPEQFWEKKRGGVIDELTEEARRRIPAALLDVSRKAIHPDPLQRYQTVRALARDLERYQAGQAVSAHRETLVEMFLRWYRRNQRIFWITTTATVLILGGAGLLLREKIKEWVTWRQVHQEDFSSLITADLPGQWTGYLSRDWFTFEPSPLTPDGPWQVEDGALYGRPQHIFDVISRTVPVPGDLRVEWDVTALAIPADLNMFLGGTNRRSAYTFHIGRGGVSTAAELTKGAVLQRLADVTLPQPLEIGVTYRMRAEREGKRIRLFVDGRKVIDSWDPEPLTGIGHRVFGFEVARGNEIRLDNITVYNHPLPQKVSPLAVPDRLAAEGQVAVALSQYRELAATYPSTDLAHTATLRIARSLADLDSLEAAAAVYAQYIALAPNHELAPVAEYERSRVLSTLGKTASSDSLVESLIARYAGRRTLVPIVFNLRADRQTRVDEAEATLGRDTAADSRYRDWLLSEAEKMERWNRLVGLKPDPDGFLDDAVGVLLSTNFGLDPFEVLSRLPSQRASVAAHLAGNASAGLVLDSFPERRGRCAQALERAGAFERVLSDYSDRTDDCVSASFGAGRYRELIERYPGYRDRCAEALLALGENQRVLDEYPDQKQYCARALFNMGAYEQVLEQYPSAVGASIMAAEVLGRADAYLARKRGLSVTIADAYTSRGQSDSATALLLRGDYQRSNAPYALMRAMVEGGVLERYGDYVTRSHPTSISLVYRGRIQEALARFADNRPLRADVLVGMGLTDSAIAVYSANEGACVEALRGALRYQDIRRRYPLHREGAAQTLLSARRYQEVVDSFPDQYIAGLYARLGLGRYDEALSQPSSDREVHARTLLKLGRLDDARRLYPEFQQLYAFEAMRAAIAGSTSVWWPDEASTIGVKLVLNGQAERLQDPGLRIRRKARMDAFALQALHAWRAGSRRRAEMLIAQFPPLYNFPDDAPMVVTHYLLLPVLRALEGDRTGLEELYGLASDSLRYLFHQRLYHCAAYLADSLTDEAFLAQPYQPDVDISHALMHAIRADLHGDAATARAEYRRFWNTDPSLADSERDRSLRRSGALLAFVWWRMGR